MHTEQSLYGQRGPSLAGATRLAKTTQYTWQNTIGQVVVLMFRPYSLSLMIRIGGHFLLFVGYGSCTASGC